MERDDVELIHNVLSGDETAFNDLVQKYQKSVHALAWRKIGDFHIAEEITQDTFLQAYKKLAALKNPNQFAGWLYVIADRLCKAWFRKKQIHTQSLETTSVETLERAAYADYACEQREDAAVENRRKIVQKLMEKLPESERTVMVLHYLGEMSCKAISKFLGVSPNTVKSRLKRARERLKDKEHIIRETFGSVPLSPNLIENIMRDIANVKQPSPSIGKPLLPLGALGSSLFLVLLLMGASHQYLPYFQLPYSFDAKSENTIEIVEMPIIPNIRLKPVAQNRIGSDAETGKSSNDGLQKGNSSMQNNLAQDSIYWKLPEGAKARLGKGYAFDITYSPDGTLFATGGTIGIWIYDALTGKELNLLTEHTDGVSAIAFSPDNRLLASDGKENTILLWDTQTGQLKTTLTGHLDTANSVAFSPDGKTLASGSRDETIRLWDVSTGELRLTFAGHADGVSDVIYSPDGKMLASHGGDEMIHLWNAHTGKFIRTLTGQTDYIHSIAYSPDGKILAGGIDDGTIHLWGTDTGHLKTTLKHTTASNRVGSVVFSPDGQTLMSADWADDMIRFWDVATGERLKTIENPPDTTNNILFSPDGNTYASAGGDGTIRFWDVETTQPIRTLNGYMDMFRDMTYSPDGSTLVVSCGRPKVQLWDTNTKKLIRTYSLGSFRIIHCIACAPDGVTLACGGYSSSEYNTVFLLSTETGEYGRFFRGHKDMITSVAFSPDGLTLASGDESGTIHLWDAATGESLKKLVMKEDGVNSIGFLPDGQTLVSTNNSGYHFWDVTTGKTVKTIPGDAVPPETKARIFRFYSPDGSTYAFTHPDDNQVRIWNTDTDELKQTFTTGHIQGVCFHLYSPDGRTLATAGWDSTILLWDVPQ